MTIFLDHSVGFHFGRLYIPLEVYVWLRSAIYFWKNIDSYFMFRLDCECLRPPVHHAVRIEFNSVSYSQFSN